MTSSSDWIQAAARGGYFSRGVVYTIIGIFAALASLGAGDNKDTKGALEQLLHQPFGTVLVAALIVGLLGFVAWRLIQALLDADNHGLSLKGLVVRVALFVSAVTYGTLALYAVSLLGLGIGDSSGSSSSGLALLPGFLNPRIVAWMLALIFLGIALAHWWKALTGKFKKHFKAAEAPMGLVTAVSVTGLIARGFVFLILAAMLVLGAANTSSPVSDPPGIKDALQFVQQLAFGRYLLFALAVGLLLFSAYSYAEARWRRVNTGDY